MGAFHGSRRGRARGLVRDLERRPAAAAARAGRPRARVGDARPVRALRRAGRGSARAPWARCAATSPSARTRAWRSTCTCGRSSADRASAGRCSRIYWPGHGRSAPQVVRGYAPRGRPRLGGPGGPPLACKKLNVIAFSCLNWIAQLPHLKVMSRSGRSPRSRPGASGRPGDSSSACTPASTRARPSWRRRSRAGGRASWRPRAAGPRPCSSRATRRGGRRHLRAAQLRRAARDRLPRVHRRGGLCARASGHGLALKLAAIRRARELGGRRLVADTSPGNAAMLALNERLGYVAVLDVRNLEGIP